MYRFFLRHLYMQATGDYRVGVFISREWELSIELLVRNISTHRNFVCHQNGIFYLSGSAAAIESGSFTEDVRAKHTCAENSSPYRRFPRPGFAMSEE